jgi:hypothetical protein
VRGMRPVTDPEVEIAQALMNAMLRVSRDTGKTRKLANQVEGVVEAR